MFLVLLACVDAPTGRNTEVIASLPSWDTPDTGGTPDSGPSRVDTGDGIPDWQPDPSAPAVRLNEVVSHNDSTWAGDDASWPDWIELYNDSDAAVNLAELMVRDTSDRAWLGGEGTLEPGARLVLIADGGEGALHTPFRLDSETERLILSVSGHVSDRLSLGSLPTDIAWARVPDGGPWAPTIHTTPDAANPSSGGASLDPRDLVYQLDDIPSYDFTLSSAAIDSLRASRLTYVEGQLTVPEGDFGDVDIKLKSYVGSSRTIDQKCAFKLDVNDYGGRKYHGLGKLTLNNMVQDYTYVHEYAAYALFRAMGVPAPRVGYARVSVNGSDFGLYLSVESIDSAFLREWFGSDDGNLYEGAYGVDFYDYYVSSFDFKGGDGVQDRSDLQEVVDILDDGATEANYARLQEVVDMDELLANMAVEALTLHWDGYSTANNYRLYKDPRTGKFSIIPWGADQTFITAYFTPWTGRGRLFQWCLAVESCSDRYDTILREATYTMDALDLATQEDDLEAWLRSEISTDARREIDMATHDYYLQVTEDNITSYPQSVRDMLDAR